MAIKNCYRTLLSVWLSSAVILTDSSLKIVDKMNQAYKFAQGRDSSEYKHMYPYYILVVLQLCFEKAVKPSSYLTLSYASSYIDLIILNILPCMPAFRHFYNKTSRQTESKAFSKSINAAKICFLLCFMCVSIR